MMALTRVVLAWAVGLGASACSFPRPQGDAEDLPDAGSDGGSTDPSDVDGDGHKNEADNCPDMANADQADRDGDEVGDGNGYLRCVWRDQGVAGIPYSLRPSGVFGLRTFGMTASFDYVFIVDKAAAP
jgi:hypothetical protein